MPAIDVDQYLRGIEEPRRTTLEELGRTILEIAPDSDRRMGSRRTSDLRS
jgi:hypothetical protein